MAMRRRVRSFSRRSKTPTQWVTNTNVAWNGNAESAVAAATLTTFSFIQTGTAQATIAGDQFLMPQRFTVLRIVGDFMIRNNQAAAGLYSWGIMRLDENASAITPADPTGIFDADRSWLYLRHGYLDSTAAPAGNQSNLQTLPSGAHFDIKVKRKMTNDQRIVLCYIASTATLVTANIRTLVARVA